MDKKMCLLLLLFSFAIGAEPFSIGNKAVLHSKVLGEQREILIYTPTDYEKSRRYQVIYLLDAEHFFTSTVGTVEALVSTSQIPDSIVVGVKTTVRVRDYLPPIAGEPQSRQQKWTQKKFPQYGGTDNFTSFLQSELFPYVEKHYSTLPGGTLIGFSNGGVFGLHTLVNRPQTFTNYLLISPAAWWSGAQIDQNIARFGQAHDKFYGNLFLTVAGEGRGIYSNGLRIVANLENHAPKGLDWSFRHFEQETHESTVFPSIYQGLKRIFADFNIKEIDGIAKLGTVGEVERYYAELSKKYSYEVKIPEAVFSDLADKQFGYDRPEQAIKTLKMFVAMYPKSSFAHSSLGRGFMRVKQPREAKTSFEKALSIATEQGIEDPTVFDFLRDMINSTGV